MITLNKEEVIFGYFPDGSTYLDKNELNVRAYNYVEWTYSGCDSDFFELALLKEFTDSIGKSALLINCMPHARMDRDNPSYVMSLRTATSQINQLNYDKVDVVEPHSDVTPGMLERVTTIHWCTSVLHDVIDEVGADTLFLPDAGAAKRYISPIPSAVGYKERDFHTGEIVNFDLTGKVGKRVLVVDDLCSGGGTFIHSARLLKKKGAEKVFLLVANCEGTALEGELFQNIEMMYTAEHNKINLTWVPTDLEDNPMITFL